MSSKQMMVAALAIAATLGAGVAQAHGRDDVQWSVTIGTPVYRQPVPVYSTPAYDPAYGNPVYGAPVYAAPGYRHESHYREPSRWDVDGDGIPNRYDRVYNPRWDRDGDGIPNRYDRYDNLRHDRAGGAWHEERREHWERAQR